MSAETYAGAGELPANPWSPEQFDVCIQDDEWLDRFMKRIDGAVEKAVGTPGLADIETARGVIAALRRRRNGEADDFGEHEGGPVVSFTNEKGTPIRAGVERSTKDPTLIRLWMESPTSRVENTMTNVEGLALWTLLQRLFKVGAPVSAAYLDAHLPKQRDVREWLADLEKHGQSPEVDDRGPGECFADILKEVRRDKGGSDIYEPAKALSAIEAHAERGLRAIAEEIEQERMDAKGDALDRGL